MKAIITDAVMFKEWLEEKKQLGESSVIAYYKCVRSFLIRNPDIDNLESYNEYLIEKIVKKRMNIIYTALRYFIEYRINDIVLKNKLISGLIVPRDRDPLIVRKYLDDKKRIEVINNLKYEKHKVVAVVQTLTGVRAGDILRTKRGSIYYEDINNKPSLRIDIIGKGRKRNTVYIFDDIGQEIILNYINNCENYKFLHPDYYFLEISRIASRRANIKNEALLLASAYMKYWMDLKQALQTAGVNKEDFATHDFRRCFAREIWDMYKDLHILQNALNHRDPRVTLKYLKHSGLQNRDILYEYQNR